MRLKTWAPLATTGIILVAGCAGAPPPGQPAPENLPALESEFSRNPRDAGLATRVGIAYYNAKQYERARDVLRSALVLGEQNYPARVYLGLTYEELGQLDSARTAYTVAATQTRDSRRRAEIQDRLTLLTRKELRAAARDAVAREATLSSQPPTENAVAVFPFRYVGTNQDLVPVGRGLTHLMITDLAKISRLRLLEREQVQALVDELALTDDGRVDARTGARSGRLLRAARVLQGSVQDLPGQTQVKLDATMVDAANASVVASGTGSDQLQQLFALQKQVLFRLVDQLGIPLTPAERRALSERPTADLQAFLAFSRGLEAEDRGDWQAAEGNFTAAVARDPNFRAAKDKQQVAQRIATTLQVPAVQLAGAGQGEPSPPEPQPAAPATRSTVLRDGVLNTVPSVGSTVVSRIGPAPVSRVPGTRPQLPEFTGADTPGGSLFGTIVIIITRP
jgi:TolB-like protein